MYYDVWIRQRVFIAPASAGGHPDQGLPGYDRPVDPGYGQPIHGRPGQGLPGYERPVDPGYGQPGFGPVDPGFGVRPPVDPGYGHPGFGGRPDNSLPGYGRPDHGLPQPPHPWLPGYGGGPVDPGYGRPGFGPPDPGYGRPVYPNRPDAGLPYPPVRPDNSLPWAPVRPDIGLPQPPSIWGPGSGRPPSPWGPGFGGPPDPGFGGGIPAVPIYSPLPPGQTPPSSPPTELPDAASPGYWCFVVRGSKSEAGFVQTSLITDEGHEPVPPEQGQPGEWVAVADSTGTSVYAWIPDVERPDKPGNKPPKPDKPEPKKHATS